ncbi:TIGR00304 family membrane protein [Methanococcoides sp. FTZ1]|uniref:TIGR00304 family membrane protein n=1 Tax=Methanococcoides sp. FTZ1 TaxID=3439061 RepID=UPI003F8394DB
MRSGNNDLQLGSLLIFIGFFLVFAGIIANSVTSSGSGSFGGLVMIGPIPIAFGSSPGITNTMMWVGLVIALLYVLSWRRRQ